MKKNAIIIGAMILSSLAFSQVGINTTSPVEVIAKNATGTTTKVEGLLIPRVSRERAQSMAVIPVV